MQTFKFDGVEYSSEEEAFAEVNKDGEVQHYAQVYDAQLQRVRDQIDLPRYQETGNLYFLIEVEQA